MPGRASPSGSAIVSYSLMRWCSTVEFVLHCRHRRRCCTNESLPQRTTPAVGASNITWPKVAVDETGSSAKADASFSHIGVSQASAPIPQIGESATRPSGFAGRRAVSGQAVSCRNFPRTFAARSCRIHYYNRALRRLQLQTELFLNSGKERVPGDDVPSAGHVDFSPALEQAAHSQQRPAQAAHESAGSFVTHRDSAGTVLLSGPNLREKVR